MSWGTTLEAGNFFVMFNPIILSVILLIEASESMRDKC